MKTISILLTKYSDWVSKFVYHISGRGYTHASVALEEDETRFYSFNYRGFCIETIDAHRRRGVKKSLCYQIGVSDEVYLAIQKRIHEFEFEREQYSYTKMGLVFAILQIPFKWENHYICTQFVAELLSDSGAFKFKKDVSIYLPNHFCSELEKSLRLKDVIYNFV